MSLLGGALRPAEPRSSEPDPRWRGVWPGVSAARRTVQSSLFLLRQFPSSLTAGPCDIARDRMRTEQRAAGLGSRRPLVAGASCPCSGRTLGAGAVPAAPGPGRQAGATACDAGRGIRERGAGHRRALGGGDRRERGGGGRACAAVATSRRRPAARRRRGGAASAPGARSRGAGSEAPGPQAGPPARPSVSHMPPVCVLPQQ